MVVARQLHQTSNCQNRLAPSGTFIDMGSDKILILDSVYRDLLWSLPNIDPNEGSDLLSDIEDYWQDRDRNGYGNGAELSENFISQGFDARRIVVNDLHYNHTPRRNPPIQNLRGDALSRLGPAGRYALSVSSMSKLILEVVDRWRPQFVYVMNPNFVAPWVIKGMQGKGSKVIAQISSYLPPKQFMSKYDLVITALPSIVEAMDELGVRSKLIPLWFNPKWENMAIAWGDRELRLIFSGSLGRHHQHTYRLLAAAKEVIPEMRIFATSDKRKAKKFGLLENLGQPVFGKEMFQTLGNSQLVLNRHAKLADNYSVNLRMFEATGMGAALLTEKSSNLLDLFDEKTVFEYGSISDLQEILQKYLSSPEIFSNAANQAMKRTRFEHNANVRANQIAAAIRAIIE